MSARQGDLRQGFGRATSRGPVPQPLPPRPTQHLSLNRDKPSPALCCSVVCQEYNKHRELTADNAPGREVIGFLFLHIASVKLYSHAVHARSEGQHGGAATHLGLAEEGRCHPGRLQDPQGYQRAKRE